MKNRKYELLLVDDELANLQKLQRTFIGQYNVHLAQSGEEALEIIRKAPIDAIITDQKMPGMTGIELLESSQKTHPNIVRIVLIGFTEVSDLIAAINSGKVHKYITKPWEPDDLRLAVQDALEKMELVRENERLASELKEANENGKKRKDSKTKTQTSPKVLAYPQKRRPLGYETFSWPSQSSELPANRTCSP